MIRRLASMAAWLAWVGFAAGQCLVTRALQAQQPSPADTSSVATRDTSGSKPVPQRDIWDVAASILHIHKPPTPPENPDSVRSAILILPVFGITPSAGVSLGAGVSYIGRIGPAGSTRLSQANVTVSYSTKGQFNVTLTPTLYLPNNRFSIEGDIRYLSLTQTTYGLGPLRPDSDADDMGFNLLRTYVTGYVSVAKGLYLGLGYRLDYYFHIVDHDAIAGEASAFLDYNNGVTVTSTTASGPALSIVYETRDNPINASRGYYARLDVVQYPTWLGNATSWTLFRYDFRHYFSFDPHNHTILALWTFGWLTSAHPPYLSLPAIGWDRDNNSGRGYVQGQIRTPSMFYGEAELRQQLTANGLIGGVLFTSLTAASYPTTRSFGPANPAYGVGMRLKLNKKSDQNIRFDLAFTPAGPARFFLGASEAF